jgi:hypothetical protein
MPAARALRLPGNSHSITSTSHTRILQTRQCCNEFGVIVGRSQLDRPHYCSGCATRLPARRLRRLPAGPGLEPLAAPRRRPPVAQPVWAKMEAIAPPLGPESDMQPCTSCGRAAARLAGMGLRQEALPAPLLPHIAALLVIMAHIATIMAMAGPAAFGARPAASRRSLPPPAAVREVFMPALSSTMTSGD